MEKIWHKHYPDNVSETVDLNTFSSLVDLVDKSVAKFGDQSAYSNLGHDITFNELDVYATRFAAFLQQHLKLQKGERLSIILPNILQFPICLFGALKAGLVVVNMNPLYTAREMIHQLNDAGVETVVVLANMAYVLEQALPKTKIKNIILTELADVLPNPKRTLVNLAVRYIKRMVPSFSLPAPIKFNQALKIGSKHTFQSVELCHEDLAFLQYTGGTTGVAKGAMLTHGNLTANVTQLQEWFKPIMTRVDEEVIITALPLYHIFSLTCNCFLFLTYGGRNILITNPRDIFGFVKELGKFKFSAITAVNTLYSALLHVPQFAKLDFSRLKFAVAGGMSLQRHVAEEWHRVTGVPIIEGYGLTETSPVLTVNPTTITSFTGSIGLPLPNTDVVIRNDHNEDVLLGETGEICAKGPQVMSGYWHRPDETAGAFSEDGYFRTGDIATMDEGGYIRIVDRKKDMILVSGFNVFPNEIEEIIAQHPGVLECAVIGSPDDRSGEVVKAVIVPKTLNLTEDAIINHCTQKLTRYKVPKIVEFREDLPKSNIGKILRRALR